jgi:hypothetical protein
MVIHRMDKGSQSVYFCDDAAVDCSVCVSMLNRQLFEQSIELVRPVPLSIDGSI